MRRHWNAFSADCAMLCVHIGILASVCVANMMARIDSAHRDTHVRRVNVQRLAEWIKTQRRKRSMVDWTMKTCVSVVIRRWYDTRHFEGMETRNWHFYDIRRINSRDDDAKKTLAIREVLFFYRWFDGIQNAIVTRCMRHQVLAMSCDGNVEQQWLKVLTTQSTSLFF